MKKSLKKLTLSRESLCRLTTLETAAIQGARVAAGTHYESICLDLCKPAETEA